MLNNPRFIESGQVNLVQFYFQREGRCLFKVRTNSHHVVKELSVVFSQLTILLLQ